MKFGLTLAACLALAACDPETKASRPMEGDLNAQASLPGANTRAAIWVDPVTGCNQIVVGQTNALTSWPRLRADGRPGYGCKDMEP